MCLSHLIGVVVSGSIAGSPLMNLASSTPEVDKQGGWGDVSGLIPGCGTPFFVLRSEDDAYCPGVRWRSWVVGGIDDE